MKNLIEYFWVLAKILIFGHVAIAAIAAPLKITTSLPLTGNDIAQAQATLKTQEAAEQFINFVKNLEVFPDHHNPTDINHIENRSIKKAYFVAPYFQAAEERSAVGGQETAEQGIMIIAEAYELLGAFDFELFTINQIVQEKKRKAQALEKMRKRLPTISDPLALQSLERLITHIEVEIAALDKKTARLEEQATRGMSETSQTLKRQVISQIQLKLSFLGVTASDDETVLLNSADVNQLREGIASIIARATSLGQFGYRNATYEAGYTKQQRDWIGLYRAIRPDVTVSALATTAVYARGTALTAKNAVSDEYGYFLSTDNIINAPRIFLAVNGGSAGACGNTKTCNVTLEYTWLGASMAQTSQSGAMAMPVYFEADVTFVQPDFEGSVSCDFTNGFTVRGRSDVKDGAIIYDGDVYNKLNYSANEDGSCSYRIDKGDANSAAYYTIKTLYDHYLNLKMQRAVKSRAEMDRYREYVNHELAYHANRSQHTNFDFWSLTTWRLAFGDTWGTVASLAIGAARSFYWHTRIEDSTTTEAVKFATTIKETTVQKSERLAFDAFTMVCWKKAGSHPYLAACPAKGLLQYHQQADTDLGKNQQLCDDNGVSTTCLERANDTAREAETDDNHVIKDPWA